jgi:hypothetical protein
MINDAKTILNSIQECLQQVTQSIGVMPNKTEVTSSNPPPLLIWTCKKNSLQEWQVCHTKRLANTVAHLLAKFGLTADVQINLHSQWYEPLGCIVCEVHDRSHRERSVRL